MRRIVLLSLAVAACRGSDREPTASRPPPVVAAAPVDAMPADAAVDAAVDAAFVRVRGTAEADQLVERLVAQSVTLQKLDADQLRLLHAGEDCFFAYLAARELETRGDAAFLPVRGKENEPEQLARRLCLISTITETKDRARYLRDFLPPTGTVRHSIEKCREELPPGTTDAHVVTKVSRAKLTGEELSRMFTPNTYAPACIAKAAGRYLCSGDAPGLSTEITLAPAADGTLYISNIERMLNTGCD